MSQAVYVIDAPLKQARIEVLANAGNIAVLPAFDPSVLG